MREAWIEEFTASAREHWTEARLAELTGGKRLAILPHEAPMLLRALGLLHRDATMPPAQMRKFLQINHVVRVLEHAIETLLARHQTIDVVDAGCGRSYLTLLLAHAWRGRLRVVGIDRNAALIEECKRRAELAGLDDVARYEAVAVEDATLRAHAVVALHACDTATDDAIALGIRAGAELIAVAPCCQAELARAWGELDAAGAGGGFAPIWGAPHLRREIAAHVTDAMRVLLLRARGYTTTPMEFVAAEHTKKNTLIRAELGGDPATRADHDALVAATGGRAIKLARVI